METYKYLPVRNPLTAFWLRNPDELHEHRSTQELPEQSDIVIIRAGYTGVSIAYHLIKERVATISSITILEARGACSGATGRNGGHLRPDMYGHIPTYIHRAGAEASCEVAEFEIACMHAIKTMIEEQEIDCDFTYTRSIDVWCNLETAKKGKVVYDDMAPCFEYMRDVVYTGKNVGGICGMKGATACASYTAGTIFPYKFIMHLLRGLVHGGKVNLQTNTPALVITKDAKTPNIFTVETTCGKIRAQKVIHASNTYMSSLLPEYRHNIVPCKGICCRITVPAGTTAPLLNNSYINRAKDHALSYLIPRADGSIIVGGAASTFKPFLGQLYNNVDDSVLIEAAKDYNNDYMQRTYRGWENTGAHVNQIWTGVMGYSYDSYPYIRVVPSKSGQFILAGLNCHGMPVIWLAAKGLARMHRIDRATNGKEEDGDIVGVGKSSPAKQ
ncbi:hypothetical protein P175DRAFT_0510936 [Aspergillus ochraceoroseus IBT 24754]|uniref:FAD dependent oxidoreductase domain-containing protein n=1 Tax=Aspergillus ochraceoroseus IBT 24754 TaxID=1392256 RepID=A0A2T5LTX2_9EURO|nr:uncharacterized protein P175DRAFT_0510936 [Aspergillus ochraceoroseus IBT 24754]PTU19730.1 hypothetical protein P175DRAFT_0510936 [Aspergillus ochraceoroseus IBT 24754]